MATTTAFTPINMDSLDQWDTADYPIETSTHIQETGFSGQVQDYFGAGFTLDANDDIVGGTLTGMNYTLNGVMQYTMTGLSHSAVTFASLQDANNDPALLAFLFSGNDVMNGSAGADVINAQGGNDVVNGNGGNDILRGNAGNDTLNGGTGNDVMMGGAGSDKYYVDALGDVVLEEGRPEIDTVSSSVNFDLLFPGPSVPEQNLLENLVLTGSAIIGYGNSLNNKLTGNAQNNELHGDPGNDALNGGSANDSLFGDSGKDTLRGSTGNDTLKGGTGNDKLYGENGNDKLNGGTGNDTLTGEAGVDDSSSTTLGTTNVDSVTDFNGTQDLFQLDNAIFTAIGAVGAFAVGDARFYFAAGATVAHDANDRIVYNTSTGALYYDADGTGGTAAIRFATLTNLAPLEASDIVVV